MTSPAGRVALVTGATNGIGRAIAEALARCGAHVNVNSEDLAACQGIASRIGGTPLCCDLTQRSLLNDLAQNAWSVRGKIDHLSLNAGAFCRKQPGEDGYEAEVDRIFDLNVHHVRQLCESLLPRMAERRSGSTVITASLAALRGNRALGAYSLTKAALTQLARDMAVRWGPSGLRVNAIAPGLIATGWEQPITSSSDSRERRLQMTPLRRIGQPHEVASTALFLASDVASLVTGRTLAVDGGTSVTDGN